VVDLFTNPARYGDLRSWHGEAAELRSAAPIHRVEVDGFDPFWAVVGYEQVMEIERQPALFQNAPRPVLLDRRTIELQQARGVELRTLIHMDAPDHPKYRGLTYDWFRPANLTGLQGRLDELSEAVVARLGELGGRCDFAAEIAVNYSLKVILAILGLPESDYARMLRLTHELFGGEDPDLARDGEVSPDALLAAMLDFIDYFNRLTADRRAAPTGDLASAIANGSVDGVPLPDVETASYYTIVATAGHDTTSSAIAGGLRALVEHPEQLRRLQREPELIDGAADEMIRHVSRVRHFMRTATADTEVAGRAVAKGDWLHLSYLAANHDPAKFEDPMTFDVERPNAGSHIAFGFGRHFCLGAQLARMQMRTLFRHLLPRIDSIEFDGEPTSMRTTFVGGPKSVPVRYTLKG
jgi:cytochrome P450